MLTANDVINGWSPANDDDVEVNVSQDLCFKTINPITSSSAFLSPTCPPLDATLPKIFSPQPQPQSSPLSALTQVNHTPMAPSSDRRAQRNRNRDPSWIPRPRNAFIIFRCEYSREHAQGGQESQNDQDPNNATVKTLSKRAAEAWKRLLPSERERYKAMADREREEHAYLYPHYRFRPMKRQVSGARKRSCERSQSPKTTSVESRPSPSAHLPSVMAAAPEKSRSNQSVEQTEVVAPVPQVTVAPFIEPSSYPIERTRSNPEILGVDYKDTVFFYPSPETTLLSDSSPSPASVELYSPLCASGVSIPPDTIRCHDPAFGLDLTHEDLERAQALEAYAIGLYNHDLFSQFPFPEYS